MRVLHVGMRCVLCFIYCPNTHFWVQLEGEDPLDPAGFHVFDGGYSTKRTANAGLVDTRDFKSSYLLSQQEVNQFQHEVKRRKPDNTPSGDNEEVSKVSL